VQLVRNAVAHGMESASERLAAGKPMTGRVRLEVTRRGQRVAFTCSDDGRGVDLEAVRRAAQRRGVAPKATHSADELLRLLLRGGMSTAASVDAYAGRGVGLDVVREAVERLGGEIDLRTEAGRGSHFELLVPVSLVSLEALLIEAGGQLAAVALDGVRGTLRVAPADVMRTAEGPAVPHDGGLARLLWLDALLGAAPARRGTRTVPAFIVADGNGADASAVAVAVDRFAGIETVLLRALPELAPADALIAGVYLDDQGNARPLLDAAVLAQRRSSSDADAAAAPQRQPTVLVVDDSLTTRMLERSILESAGYTVHLATSGEEGLEMAQGNDYALVLVDVEMPGMDGFTFVERAREHPSLRGVPCVLVTSRNAPADRRRGELAGARAYIVKGEFDQVRFLDHVASLVARTVAS
jgi:two-component system chemotaxis sensor kinase CheA